MALIEFVNSSVAVDGIYSYIFGMGLLGFLSYALLIAISVVVIYIDENRTLTPSPGS